MSLRTLGFGLLAGLGSLLAAVPAHAGIKLQEIRFPQGLTAKKGSKTPPALAPLSQRIVFHFNGKPKIGPGLAAGLRIEVDPANGSGQPIGQLAFGDFKVSGNDIVWTPRLPSGDLPVDFGPATNLAADGSLPGLLPATTYRIVVTMNSPNSVKNLTKIAPTIPQPLTFTTVPLASGPDPFAAYFAGAAPKAPKLKKKKTFPDPGTKGIHPQPLGDPAGLFAGIPAKRTPPFRLQFDQPVSPSAINLARLRLRATLTDMGQVADDELEVLPVVTQNAGKNATVLLYPIGMLPLGYQVTLEMSDLFSSLSGATANDGLTPESYVPVAKYTIAQDPQPGNPLPGELHEDFDQPQAQDIGVVAEGLQPASWDAADSNVLKASFGFGGDGSLGRFMPSGSGTTLIELNTDFQPFPLFSGATPDATPGTTVQGGVFNFTDFHLPAGVTLRGVGTNPLVITATGNVLIEGMIDIAGKNGSNDDSFNSAVTPATGGSGGPGGGRGGDGHPVTLASGATSLLFMQTPPFGQTGFGPGNMVQTGGGGGQSGVTLPWSGFNNGTFCTNSNELGDGSRGSGGGGGSFNVFFPTAPENPAMKVSGRAGGVGIGNHLPLPFTPSKPFPGNPPYNSPTHPAYAGVAENAVARPNPNPTFTQAVQQGLVWDQAPFLNVGGAPTSWSNTHHVTFGGSAGLAVFADGDPENDFIGPLGEVKGIRGGQGGGGGGSRTEGLDLNCLPVTFGAGFPLTVNDAKGAGGGGAGGALMIQALGTITLNGPDCRIDARGGNGGGGEIISNGGIGGNGGGGAGGAVILQSASNVIMTGLTNLDTNPNNPPGVFRAIDVSGGCGKNSVILSAAAQTGTTGGDANVLQVGDGGPGGPGIVQVHVPVGTTSVLQTDRIGARVNLSVLNITCASITGMNANYGGTTQIDPLVPLAKTPSLVTSVSVARSTWNDLGAVVPPFRPLLQTSAGALAGPLFGVPGDGPFFQGTDPATGLVLTHPDGKVQNAFTNDFEVDSPDLQLADFLPQGNDLQTVTIRFEGADEDPANPGLPDLSTSTGFVTDATLLNGKRFVRYELVFDIAAAPGALPSPTSPRPQVNFLRLPFQY